MVDQGCWWL